MRAGGARAVRAAAALPQHYRLDARGRTQLLEEGAPVLQALDVHREVLGAGVAGEVLEVVRVLQRDAVAEAHGLADAHAGVVGRHNEVHGVGAALRDEAHGPVEARGLARPEAHAGGGVVEAHAVGADDHEAGLLGRALERGLQLAALVGVGLGEAGGEERRTCHVACDAVAHDERGDLPGDGDEDVVDVAGDVGEAAEVLDAERLDLLELVGVDLDGVEVAAGLDGLVAAEPAVVTSLGVADDDDGLGVECPVQPLPIDAHECPPSMVSRQRRQATASAVRLSPRGLARWVRTQ